MNGDDTARRVGDMTVVLDAIVFRLKAGGAAGDHVTIAAEIQELMQFDGGAAGAERRGLPPVEHLPRAG
jgi:hypothetical protein